MTRGAPLARLRARAPAPASRRVLAQACRLSTGARLIAAAIAVALDGRRASSARDWWISGRYMVSTDDAYVRAHNTTLASKISGYVASIPIEDNTQVHAGDVIATIDDGDYRLAADAAREKVATQQATVDRIGRQVVAQAGQCRAGQGADGFRRRPTPTRTQLEFDAAAGARGAEIRQRADAGTGAGRSRSGRRRGPKRAGRDRRRRRQSRCAQGAAAGSGAHARRIADRAGQGRTRPVVHRHPRAGRWRVQQSRGADRRLRADRAARREPRAARAASISKPISRRRSSARMRPGQPVSISVDALPEHAIKGTVASLSPASGSVFSLLPPDNATGNFTKIVQRLPVRIEVPAGVAAQRVLRPGMSVVVSVNTKPGHAARGRPDLGRASGRGRVRTCVNGRERDDRDLTHQSRRRPRLPPRCRAERRRERARCQSRRAGCSPSSPCASACSWRFSTSRSCRRRLPTFRPACRHRPTKFPGCRPPI